MPTESIKLAKYVIPEKKVFQILDLFQKSGTKWHIRAQFRHRHKGISCPLRCTGVSKDNQTNLADAALNLQETYVFWDVTLRPGRVTPDI